MQSLHTAHMRKKKKRRKKKRKIANPVSILTMSYNC